MKKVKQILARLMNEESGQDLIEYALVAGLIALGSVSAMKTLATTVGTALGTVGTTVTNAV